MYPTKPNNTTQKAVAGIIVILAIVMLVLISNVSRAKQSSQTIITTSTPHTVAATTGTAMAPATSASPSPTNSSGYKDGTFSAIAQYYVPGGYESIQVDLTLKNGIVSDSNIVNSENNNQSAMYQQSFASAYRSSVVGKNISDIHLSYVAGASDTTKGFDDAVTKIASDAKA
jgi:hypothetical protein